jgi:hypothetical protein
MARAREGRVETPAALLAAILVVLQALFAGLTAGAHAAPAGRDAFGGTLCINLFGGSRDDAPAGHHSGDCCAFGCHVASAAPSLSPAQLPPRLAAMAIVSRRIPAPLHVAALDRSSIRLRGPPTRV